MHLEELLEHDDRRIRQFARRVTVLATGCWQWSSVRRDGYGTYTVEGKCYVPHRWLQEHLFGPLPPGWTMDHTCRNRGCVNIFSLDHLEPVPHKENIARAENHSSQVNKAKTHCPRNHEYTPENTRWKRKYINGVLTVTGRGCIKCEYETKQKTRKTSRQLVCPNCGETFGALGPHKRVCMT